MYITNSRNRYISKDLVKIKKILPNESENINYNQYILFGRQACNFYQNFKIHTTDTQILIVTNLIFKKIQIHNDKCILLSATFVTVKNQELQCLSTED